MARAKTRTQTAAPRRQPARRVAGGRHRLGHTKAGGGRYAGAIPALRGLIRRRISGMLFALTGDRKAVMRWKAAQFHQWLYLKRRIRMVGWRKLGIPFGNLSTRPGGRQTLIEIWNALQSGELYFVKVDDEERSQHVIDVDGVAPGPFDEADRGHHHSGRSDVKKSREDHGTGLPVSKKAKHRPRGPKSQKYIDSDSD